MLRYHFDVSTGKWLVQILKLGIVWMTIKGREFNNILDAYKYVEEVGLDNIYAVQEAPRNRHLAQLHYGMGAR